MIRYQISSSQPGTRYFEVDIVIEHPHPAGQKLRLPNWIPGSYMIRDFSRNLLDLCAHEGERPLKIVQIDKSNWQIESINSTIKVSYKVYANDLSVRSAHLDHSHGYFNGSSVFLEVLGQAEQSCEVAIERPVAEFCSRWELATTLTRKQASAFEFGLYEASDYADLIDHPVEMGCFQRIRFDACGVPHDIILSGRFDCDDRRLAADLKSICEHHIRFFGEPAPMDYYQFQVLVIGDGYGGLEHRSGTSLMCRRDHLPQSGQSMNDDYREFLGLCSHEYFHTWNVKRIKPQAYQPYDLRQEVYTDLLWAFEGITSYYDDLALLRCGLIDEESYLELLAQTMTRVQRGLGRHRQSAAESSFNTWTRFYQQDENAPNAIVSYYAKGSLIAACIDLKLRRLSGHSVSLDDVMRRLWQNYQADPSRGIGENEIQQVISDIAGQDLGAFLDDLIYGTQELPLVELLESVAVKVIARNAANQQDRGGKKVEGDLPTVNAGIFVKEIGSGLRIERTTELGAAQLAGLSAGDVVVAIDGLQLSLARLEKKLLLASAGDRWRVHAFRRDELHQFDLELQPASASTIVLECASVNPPERQHWLNGR